jgi:dimethylaniline monooxygenase (N-oxide forming)
MKRIAIIGAGPSGLVSAKSAIECGLEPVVFEQASTHGGIWRSQGGFTWNSMRTNLSYLNNMFSDFPWATDTEDFPPQQAMYEYLEKYIAHFNLNPYLRFNTRVVNVKNDEDTWQIEWSNKDTNGTEKFEYVIIATGILTTPYIPSIKGLEEFKGVILHSKDYKTPDDFKDKRVIVVGGACSGAEIASEIVTTAKQVVNIIIEPFWVIPRYIPKDLNYPDQLSPLDLVFYRRAVRDTSEAANAYFGKLCGDQGKICRDLGIDPNSSAPPRVIISDSYMKEVKNNRILVKKGNVQELNGDTIIFNDGTREQADVLIFSTGYKLELPFFDSVITDKLEYKDDQLQPLILYKATFCPHLSNIAFVGMYRGPFMAAMELQARWACMIFSGKLPMPEKEEMLEGLKEERDIRNQYPRLHFPRGDFVGFADTLADKIKVLPNFEELKKENPSIHKLLWEGPVIASHFRLVGFNCQHELALEQSRLALETLESKRI